MVPAAPPSKGIIAAVTQKATICAIAVMAKAPRPGKVKTRLSPPLSPEEAMAMSAAFLRDVTENIQAAARETAIAGYVAFAPAGLGPLFDGMLAEGTGLVLADGVRDMPPGVEGFGRSLLHATQALFAQGYGSVCVLNSDSPTLPTALLVRAARLLAEPGDHAVLGPAEDGGYYLLGMKAPHTELYAGMAWSSDRVAQQTRQAARGLALTLHELEPWYDVDDRAALQRLIAEASCPGARNLAPFPAPATAACLARLGLPVRLAAA